MAICKKILVVDDNKINLKLVDLMLRRDGCETALVSESKSVLAMVESFNPCLILLDIDMPIFNGLEICRQLKKNDKFKAIPVIFVTGNTDKESIKKAFAVGCHDYVRKPVNEVELLARMHAVNAQIELTERIKYEEKLNGVLELAGTICHELNQPLQIISGSAELLLLEVAPDAPGHDLAETIAAQAHRLGRINRKLMNITSYEQTQYIGNSKIVDLEKSSKNR